MYDALGIEKSVPGNTYRIYHEVEVCTHRDPEQSKLSTY